ncbi:MAG: hypothetical protein RR646_06315 [Erysipelotrichaceae bacterium]
MKKAFIDLDGSLRISDKTTFDMFKNSSLYKGQTDNRFFWIEDSFEIADLSERFKVGLCFRNNLVSRIELYYMSENVDSEIERTQKQEVIFEEIRKNYELKYKNIENSFDKRNNYSSIIISF